MIYNLLLLEAFNTVLYIFNTQRWETLHGIQNN